MADQKNKDANQEVKNQGYCVKCKEKRDFTEGAEEVTFGKKGRKALKGKCSVCGTGMYKILPTKKA